MKLYLVLRPGPEHLVPLGSLEPQPDLQQHRALGRVEAAAAAGEAAHGQPTPGAGEGGVEQPPALDTLGPGAGRRSCTTPASTPHPASCPHSYPEPRAWRRGRAPLRRITADVTTSPCRAAAHPGECPGRPPAPGPPPPRWPRCSTSPRCPCYQLSTVLTTLSHQLTARTPGPGPTSPPAAVRGRGEQH